MLNFSRGIEQKGAFRTWIVTHGRNWRSTKTKEVLGNGYKRQVPDFVTSRATRLTRCTFVFAGLPAAKTKPRNLVTVDVPKWP